MFYRRRSQRFDKFVGQVASTRNALHGFENDSCNVISDHRLCRRTVISRNEVDVKRLRRKTVSVSGVPGDCAGASRAAMEAVGQCENFLAARRDKRHAQRILIGLGAGVDEKNTTEVAGSDR